MNADGRKIAITGASGLIGGALRRRLEGAGHHVTTITRTAKSSDEIEWSPSERRLDPDALVGFDAVVHLAGAGIGDHRWNDDYKQVLIDSRVDGTRLLAETVAGMSDGPTTIVSASAIGYYGDRGDEVLTESSEPGDGFLADLCQQWEQAMDPARAAGIRVAHIRTGIVLSHDGGALAKMLPLFKFALGGRFGKGDQYMPWITLDDEVGAIEFLLNHEIDGPVNLTAPAPVTNREFTEQLGDALNRPTLLTVPSFAPKLLLGSEMAQALLFDSARVMPTALQAHDYRFQHSTLSAAFSAILT